MDQTPEKARIEPESYITLRYRVALENGDEIVSTFDMTPATFQLGSGQLAHNLEKCLIGLSSGDKRQFVLEPQDAFGIYNEELMRRIPKAHLGDAPLLIGHPVQFMSETGVPYAGILKEIGEEDVLIDFNHPLVGKRIVFDVDIIGIL